ncbi:MAG: hypothetical protein ACLQBX_15885 [Candidatus Limnocylindrales bacterium]
MSTLEDLEESILLAHRLLEELAHSNIKMTEHLLAERSYVNDVLWIGTALPNATSLVWNKSFAGPFASVAFADPNALGLTISTGQGNETNGPGVIQIPAGDAGCVPLSDTQLNVKVGALGAGAIQGAFVIAVYAVPKPFSWSKG